LRIPLGVAVFALCSFKQTKNETHPTPNHKKRKKKKKKKKKRKNKKTTKKKKKRKKKNGRELAIYDTIGKRRPPV